MQISVRSQTAAQTTLSWQPVAGAARYRILWSDRPGETVRFKTAGESGESLFTFCRSTHIPYYIKVQALAENGALLEESTPVQTPVGRVLQQQLEALSRGLVAVTANTGVFQFVKKLHHQAAQQPSAASKIQKYPPKACKQRRFHAQFASFFRFMAANLSLTHCVTRARPLMWV